MRRQLASLLSTCGVLLILFGAGGWFGPAPVSAQQVAPQPSPRPPADLGGASSGGQSVAVTGRITGTVIDTLTGAPVPGVTVLVGNESVTSDKDGNYDHWVPAGTYNVMVAPDARRAVIVQPPVSVSVTAGGTAVQHLGVQGSGAITPGRSAAAVAAGTEPAPEVQAAAVADEQPRILPRTGIDAEGGWVWVGAGLALLVAGWLLWGRPVARLAPALGRGSRLPADFDRSALLASLLGARDQRDDLLDELLRRDGSK